MLTMLSNIILAGVSLYSLVTLPVSRQTRTVIIASLCVACIAFYFGGVLALAATTCIFMVASIGYVATHFIFTKETKS